MSVVLSKRVKTILIAIGCAYCYILMSIRRTGVLGIVGGTLVVSATSRAREYITDWYDSRVHKREIIIPDDLDLDDRDGVMP